MLTLEEYPPEWDEPDFEELHGGLISVVAKALLESRFADIDDLVNEHFNIRYSDFFLWLSDEAEDGCQSCRDVLNKINMGLHCPEIAWTYVEYINENL